MTRGYSPKMLTPFEPFVNQGLIHGWPVTWNPDDELYYVHEGEETKARFKRFANAVRYCKTHARKEEDETQT